MSFLKRSFSFGSITLPNNIFYAPLAGCSDYPFRRMTARYKPGLMFCEMVKMDALVRHDPHTFHLLDYDATMHPIGGQLVGSKVELAGASAKIIEELGFDTVDLNCGCPVDKVTKDGSGSGLLKNPQKIGDIVAEMVAAVDIPVTVKIRAGWDEKTIVGAEVTRIVEQAGATAITVHGRTRAQGYAGPANWDWIKECKEAAKNILVIGNGDVVCGESAREMFAYTGCDAVLVARGTMGRPWIVEDIISTFLGDEIQEKNVEACRQLLAVHFDEILHYQHERKAMLDARRIGCWYFKKARGNKEFRHLISRVTTPEEAAHLIQVHPLGDGGEEEPILEEC